MSTATTPPAAPVAMSSMLELQLFGAAAPDVASNIAAALILKMLDAGEGVSDLIFSPGRPPQVEKHGELTPVAIPSIPVIKNSMANVPDAAVTDWIYMSPGNLDPAQFYFKA